MKIKISNIFSIKNNPILITSVCFFVLYLLLNIPAFRNITPVWQIGAMLGFVLIIISGFVSTQILSIIFKKDFDFWENISISLLSILTLLPIILSLEASLLGKITPTMPLLNIGFLIIMLFTFLVIKKTNETPIKIPSPNKKILNSPLFIVSTVTVLLSISIFSFYEFLPDNDPYTWILRYENYFNINKLPAMSSRPLFASITFIFTSILNTEIFTFFKYILPMFLIMSLFPIWLVAKQYDSKIKQFALLSLVFISPNVILYSQTAMTQTVFIFLAYFFIFFLLYSYKKQNNFFYYLAGLVALISFFYHESAVFLLIPWALITLFSKRNFLIKNKRDFIYVFLIILFALQTTLLKSITAFVSFWTKKLFFLFFNQNINLLFPYSYKNIDGNQMGWESLDGVLKFYLYYASPFIIAIFLFFIFLLITNKINLRAAAKEILSKKELLLLFTIFLEFFLISEIFPRFPGIAFLPDRAWVFTAIFSSFFMFLIVEKTTLRKPNLFKYALLILVFTNIYGAFYINTLKKNLLTDSEINSFKWIKANIESESLIIASKNSKKIQVYSKKESVNIPSGFLSKESGDDLQDFFSQQISMAKFNQGVFPSYTNSIQIRIEKYETSYLNSKDILSRKKTAERMALDIKKQTDIFIKKISKKEDLKQAPERKIYFYYSKPNTNSPYHQRPYTQNNSLSSEEINFLTKKFDIVYSDEINCIYIWEIL